MTIEIFLLYFSGGGGVKMRDKMAISVCSFEKSRKGPILRPQIRPKDTFS